MDTKGEASGDDLVSKNKVHIPQRILSIREIIAYSRQIECHDIVTNFESEIGHWWYKELKWVEQSEPA
jgi:hypothetical protein